MININSVTRTFTVFLLAGIFSCKNFRAADTTASINNDKGTITARTFKADTGWAYEIFIDDKLFIKQLNIPVIQGNKAFPNEESAVKVATLVVNKLKHHEKPTVRLEELQQIGIVASR